MISASGLQGVFLRSPHLYSNQQHNSLVAATGKIGRRARHCNGFFQQRFWPPRRAIEIALIWHVRPGNHLVCQLPQKPSVITGDQFSHDKHIKKAHYISDIYPQLLILQACEYQPVIMSKYRFVTVTIIQTPNLDVFVRWSRDNQTVVL